MAIKNNQLCQKIKDYTDHINAAIRRLIIGNSTIEQAMIYSALASGKRIRPCLFLLTNELFAYNTQHIVNVSAAIELVHVYSLIHDDLPAMDDATHRRGQLTCHKYFDEATAILAGDALLTYAFEIISQNTQLTPKIKCQLVAELARAIGYHGMIKGQMLDMQASFSNFDLEEIHELQQLKTGKLLSFCCQAAAIINNANKKQRLALNEYANILGLIFQITDDILDYEGDEQTVGKDLQQDRHKGKATFISILGVNNSKRLVIELTTKASNSLIIFGEQSVYLQQLVELIATRKS